LARGREDVRLTWRIHGGNPDVVYIERRFGDRGRWQPVAKLPASQTSFEDRQSSNERETSSYRVVAENGAGRSAYSNVARQPQ
jgi:hypothetical protein